MANKYFLISNVANTAHKIITELDFTPKQYQLYKSLEAKLDVDAYEDITLEEQELMQQMFNLAPNAEELEIKEVCEEYPDLVEFE